MRRSIACCLALALSACHAAAGDSADGGGVCGEQKCDDPGFADALAQMNDPIAAFLKAHLDGAGQLDIAYLDMLEAIAEAQGCDAGSIDAYVISDALVVSAAGKAFPRVVNTVCSTDRTKADLAFFALSFPDADNVDVDVRTIEMFAWDPTSFEYRFYRGSPVEGSDTKVAIQLAPSECAMCHRQPTTIPGAPMPMTPIMNELSAPWEHWFAEPQSFEHSVPDATRKAPHFAAIAGEGSGMRKSAARLEQTIRSAFVQRVATARLRGRRNPADVSEAMALLRPLFCDEQLTYVTEDGNSGLLSSAAVVDEGLASVFFAIKGTGWPWEWWQDKVLRLSPAGASDRIDMMPIRGAATVAYEKQLMSVRALTPEQVLRVRALDWHTPTLSSFRCELFTHALARVAGDPPPIAAGAKNVDLLVPLLDRILTLHKGDFGIGGADLPAEIAIASPGGGKVVALGRADAAGVSAMAAALAAGSLGDAACGDDGAGACVLDPTALGGLVEARFKALESMDRSELSAQRDALGCQAKADYPNAPFIADLDCDAPPGDDGTGGGDESTGGGDASSGGSDTGGDVGDCCTVHEGTGCSDATISACVCAIDDLCCSSGWDDVCVGEVASSQCGTCP